MSAFQFAIASSSNQTVKSPRRRSPSLYSAQLRTWYFFCFACLYWQRLGYFMLEHTSATTIGGFRSQPERCNNAAGRQHLIAEAPAASRNMTQPSCRRSPGRTIRQRCLINSHWRKHPTGTQYRYTTSLGKGTELEGQQKHGKWRRCCTALAESKIRLLCWLRYVRP